jgi:hypothetical protein
VPKSRIRKKAAYTPPPPKKTAAEAAPKRWVAPVMLALFVIGLLWIVLFYIAGDSIPVMQDLGNWNLIVGFVFIGGGFVAATQWR